MRGLACWIADGEILVAPVVALLLIFPTQAPTLTGVGLAVLVGVWLVRWRMQGYPMRCTPLNLALLLLLTTVPVAVWASAVRDLTTVALAYLLAGVVIFCAVIHWARTPGRAWWTWGGLVAVGLALVVLWPISLAGIQFSGQRSVSHNRFHVSRFTFHVLRLVAVLSGLLLLATLALTQSRGAYLGFVVSALVLLSLRWPKAALVVIPLVLIVALVGVGVVGWRAVADELMTGDTTRGLDQRMEIWSRAPSGTPIQLYSLSLEFSTV